MTMKRQFFFMLRIIFLTHPQNLIALYYGGVDNTCSVWANAIQWSNRIGMSSYVNAGNTFEKFISARDKLNRQGGGVLYSLAGIYNLHATKINTT
jgi:hypothetical protein